MKWREKGRRGKREGESKEERSKMMNKEEEVVEGRRSRKKEECRGWSKEKVKRGFMKDECRRRKWG